MIFIVKLNHVSPSGIINSSCPCGFSSDDSQLLYENQHIVPLTATLANDQINITIYNFNCCGKTFHCDDNKITECDITDTYNSSTAYILLYKLIMECWGGNMSRRAFVVVQLGIVECLQPDRGGWELIDSHGAGVIRYFHPPYILDPGWKYRYDIFTSLTIFSPPIPIKAIYDRNIIYNCWGAFSPYV